MDRPTINLVRTDINSETEPAPAPKEPTIRDEIDDNIAERRKLTIERMELTFIYLSKIGGSELMLDDIPGIHKADGPFVLQWLTDNNIKWKKPRFNGRVTIYLERKEEN